MGGSISSDGDDAIAVAPPLGLDQLVRLDGRDAVDRALAARVYLRVFPPRITVAAPALGEDAGRALQARIDRLLDECGCGIGAAVALAATVAYLAFVMSSGAQTSIGGIVLRSLGVMFLGATAGKLVGIARARLELRGVLLGLRRRLD